MTRIRTRPTILVTEPAYFQSVMGRLRKVGRVIPGSPARRDLERNIRDCDAAVIRVETVLDGRILRGAKNLKLIASATTGLNHIDTATARKRGIRIIHLHGTHTQPTAEHTLALMLSLARRIPEVQDGMKRGRWNRTHFFGRQLGGKTLGIVGLGRIGKAVARMCRGLGMTVLAYDPYVRGIPGVRMCRTLAALLGHSDVVSIHAALTPETRGLFGSRAFGHLRPGSLLINTARGEIVEEKSLLSALSSGRLAGAALDVYRLEPLPSSHFLRAHARRNPHLILTPHLGASTEAAIAASAAEIAKGVETFFRPE